jgi:hypothetical protein
MYAAQIIVLLRVIIGIKTVAKTNPSNEFAVS